MREIPPDLRASLSDADIAEIAAHPITFGEATERDDGPITQDLTNY
jgi:hypothetical protein